jgi:hypothetical protein
VAFSEIEVSEYARKVGKTERTLWRWIKQGCNPRDPKSLREWQVRNQIRETPIERARKRRRDDESHKVPFSNGPQASCDLRGNGDLPPIGKKGAAAALKRLEASEERAHARLEAALARGNPVEVQACQEFWLRCSETLRRLDLAVEIARRQEETQVPLKLAEDTVTAATEWMRVSLMQFLSSEVLALMALKDVGEFKAYFVERFRGILNLTVMNSLRTRSPVPEWASRRIKEAWNVSQEPAETAAGNPGP